MAQAKVTSFFKTRKGTSDVHASKRRKLQSVQNDVVISQTSLEEKADPCESKMHPLVNSEILGNLNVQSVNKTRSSLSEPKEKTEVLNLLLYPQILEYILVHKMYSSSLAHRLSSVNISIYIAI